MRTSYQILFYSDVMNFSKGPQFNSAFETINHALKRSEFGCLLSAPSTKMKKEKAKERKIN